MRRLPIAEPDAGGEAGPSRRSRGWRSAWGSRAAHRPARGSLASRLALILLSALLGGCLSLPMVQRGELAPPPRFEATISPFQYSGDDGHPVEGFVAFPAGPSAPARVSCLLFLHGQIGFWRAYRRYALQFARLGYGVLYINYYSGGLVNLKEGIRPFKDRVRRLRLMLDDMARGVDALVAHPRCDPGSVSVVGFSLGGSYAFHVAALRPKKVAAIISFYGGYRFPPLMDTWDLRLSLLFADEDGLRWNKWFATQDPTSILSRIRSPVLLFHGRSDGWIPYQQAEDFYAEVRARGLPADLVAMSGAGHDFMFALDPTSGQIAVRRVTEFLERRVIASSRRRCPHVNGSGKDPAC